MVEKSVHQLRFKGFTEEWVWLNFEDIFKSVSPKKFQIKSAEINEQGTYEVVDQGQDEIAGYYNDENKLFSDLPIIIYGDHTTFVKYRDEPFIVGADGVKLLAPKINANLKYLFYALEYFNIKPEGYKRHFSILKKISLPVPSLDEQKKMSNFLTTIDIKIKLLEREYKLYQNFKKYMMQQIFTQKLRFNFNDDWNWLNFDDIFKSVPPKKFQIKSAEINEQGTYEVVDQGQDEIAGYYDDKNKLFSDLPIIIYGDHTTFVKYREKPFIVGADGVKLLAPKINANLKYLFYALEYFNIKPEGYKRHFSILKKISLPMPILEEQNEISNMFISIDMKLKYTQIQLQETKEFKKGLLQQMFFNGYNNQR